MGAGEKLLYREKRSAAGDAFLAIVQVVVIVFFTYIYVRIEEKII